MLNLRQRHIHSFKGRIEKTCKLKYYDVKWNGLNMSKIFLKIGPCDTEYNNNTIRKKTHTR